MLLIALATMVAGAGIVYATWSATTHIKGTIDTADVAVVWDNVWTNDDGVGSGTDGEASAAAIPTGYNAPNGTSADPSDGAVNATRFDYNVGSCLANVGGAGVFNVTIADAYPGYYCYVVGHVVNEGSIPMTPSDVAVTATKDGAGVGVVGTGTEGEFEVAPSGGADLTFNIMEGVTCDMTVDPGVPVEVGGWVRVEPGADPGATYELLLDVEWMPFNQVTCAP